MRQRLLAIVVLLSLAVTWPAHADTNSRLTGNDLLSGCANLVQKLENKSGTKLVPEASLCLGFAMGFLAGRVDAYTSVAVPPDANKSPIEAVYIREGRKAIERRFSYFCFPDHVTQAQVVRVFLRYMKNNPQQLHEPAGNLLASALTEAFPCRK